VDGGESTDLIGALQVLADAMDIKLEVRGTRSAQRLLSDRLGFDLEKLPIEGAFPTKAQTSKGTSINKSGSSGESVLLAPRMWTERMFSSPRIRQSLGQDVLKINSSDAQKLGVRDGFSVEIEVNGKARDAIVRVDDAVGAPVLPALEGELAGSVAGVKIAVMAGGDD
jgi:hypothetical protein